VRILRRLAVGMLVVATLGAMQTQAAFASAGPSDDVKSVLARLKSTGQLSAADRQTLLRNPAWAARVIDPNATQMGEEEGTNPALAEEVGTTACTWHYAWIRGRTALGFVAYRWNHRVDWCYNGSNVTWVSQSSWTDEMDGNFYFRGKNDTLTPVWRSYVESRSQAHIENCVPWAGCIRSNYPWVKHHMHGNGHWYYTAGH
jgi:hypothetical protein